MSEIVYGQLYVHPCADTGDAISVSRWARGKNGGLSADTIARLHIPTDRITRDELNDYAHKFAAAEEMLEALEGARMFLTEEYYSAQAEAMQGHPIAKEARRLFETVSAAIAKARGAA